MNVRLCALLFVFSLALACSRPPDEGLDISGGVVIAHTVGAPVEGDPSTQCPTRGEGVTIEVTSEIPDGTSLRFEALPGAAQDGSFASMQMIEIGFADDLGADGTPMGATTLTKTVSDGDVITLVPFFNCGAPTSSDNIVRVTWEDEDGNTRSRDIEVTVEVSQS